MRTRVLIVCFFGFVLVAVRSQRPLVVFAADAPVASQAPMEDALEASVKAATGKRPDNEHIVIAEHRDGSDGTLTQYRLGSAFREIDVLGPFTEQSGHAEDKDWRTNENGELIPQEREAGLAAADPYTTKITRVSQPIDAYVIAHLNARGTGTRRFVDPVNYHIVRVERIFLAQTVTTIYDDFRTVDGYTRAWHWTTDDGEPADAGNYHITTLEAGTVKPADVAKPESLRLVNFPAGVQNVQLPVTMHDGKFIVRLMVQGRGLDFILDTGAGGIFIDDDVARSLGLHIENRSRQSGAAGPFTSGHAIVPRIDIGSISMTNVAISTSPHLDEQNPGEFKAVGLLGFDFISGMELVLDYGAHKVTAYAPDVVAVPQDPKMIVLPIRLGSESPTTDATVNGALGERFIVDTGAANVGFVVFDYFARRYPDAVKDRGASSNIVFEGVGGRLSFVPFQAHTVKLANVTFSNIDGYRITGKSYGAAEDGLIGPPFLQYFTVYLDYASSQMVLVPNDLGRKAMGSK